MTAKAGKVLIERNPSRIKALLANKTYDTNGIRNILVNRKIKPCIPPKSNRKIRYPYDGELCKKRAKIENMFSKLKDWPGIAFAVAGVRMWLIRRLHGFEHDIFLCPATIGQYVGKVAYSFQKMLRC